MNQTIRTECGRGHLRLLTALLISHCSLFIDFFQVSANTGASSMSGYLERTKANKKQWRRFWFVILNKVLYTYAASEVRLAAFFTFMPKTSCIFQDKIEMCFTPLFNVRYPIFSTLPVTGRAEFLNTEKVLLTCKCDQSCVNVFHDFRMSCFSRSVSVFY